MTVVIQYDRDPPDDYPVLRAPFQGAGRSLYVSLSDAVENISETTTGDVHIGYTDGDIDTIEGASIVRVS